MEEMTHFSSATERIREFGEKIGEPMGLEVDCLRYFAETLLNGNPMRREELLNIMNCVSLSVQEVLRTVDDPVLRAVKIERLKEKMGDANQRLVDMMTHNNNGNHDRVAEIR